MSIEVKYNGAVIASLKAGQTATLACAGKLMASDIVIKVGKQEAPPAETPNLISFTIDGTVYQAEEGMTWVEWCESDYNTDTSNAQNIGSCIYVGAGRPLFEEAGCTIADHNSDLVVSPTEEIISNHDYYEMVGGFD